MTETATLTVIGAPGSPYSRKLRAVLRYRRIPHAWVHRMSPESRALPQPRVPLLPTVVTATGPGGALEARTDSTPLIRAFERERGGRAAIPPDPVVAFLDAILEDYADEWLARRCSTLLGVPGRHREAAALAQLPRWGRTDVPEADARAMGEMIAKRQIDRLWVVGSNATTGPVIEASYRRLLERLDAHLERSRFVMGARPGASDFALYGQLTQLALFDPTPAALALEVAPRVVAWVDVVEDLSGLEPTDAGWWSRDAIPPTFTALLAEAGRVYAPFLLANAAALKTGAERVECEIDGRPWVQQPFPYQGKCLAWLREAHAALAPADRRAADAARE
jgi:glutathione S-transferase